MLISCLWIFIKISGNPHSWYAFWIAEIMACVYSYCMSHKLLTMDFASLWNILCEGSTSPAADPFGYMECLCLSTPNICSEKIIFCFIVSEIKQIGHIEILIHLLPKFS